MKIYLCARYSRLNEMQVRAAALEREGHKITATWINVNNQEKDIRATQEKAQTAAIQNCTDLAKADIVICFTEEPNSPYLRGGRHVEMGLALGLGKWVVVIGSKENIFCCLPQVEHFPTWTSFIETIRKNINRFL